MDSLDSGCLGSRVYLEGQGDLVSRLITNNG